MNYQELIDGVLNDFLDSITGIIVVWTGAIADIPPGWILCDGNNGTPDLRDRIIRGAGNTYAVDDTGGAMTHTHPMFWGTHRHEMVGGSDIFDGGPDGQERTTLQLPTGDTDAGSMLPPVMGLAYIKKVA